MKNQIIKKIMAYLLVGAMVITTPMTASAAGLADAYDTGTGSDEDKSSNTNTDTNTDTNTNTGGVDPDPVDPAIPDPEAVPRIWGLTLNPDYLEFDGSEESKVIQASVIFDNYNPEGEEMAWAGKDPITAAQKKAIEDSIHWYVEGNDCVKFDTETPTGNKVIVMPTSGGNTKVYAWIEADGKASDSGNTRPTEGDWVAKADVIVKKSLSKIVFNESAAEIGYEKFNKFTWGKRQYDLKKYTILEYTDGTKELAKDSNINLTYSITDPKALKADKVNASLTDAGILKVSKGAVGKSIKIDIVSEGGLYSEGSEITLVEPKPITFMGKFSASETLDMGVADQKSKTVNCPSITPSITETTDELVWSSNKPAIVSVEGIGEGDKAEIIAKGVGTAKITVKASSGKKAVLTVNAYATPSKVEITGENSGYSGKPINLKAVLLDENGNDLPVGNTTFKWEGVKGDKNAKVKGKKDSAVVTPSNLLTDLEKEVTTEATVTAKYKNAEGTKTMPAVSLKIKLKQSDVKEVSIGIFQKLYNGTAETLDTMAVTNGKNAKESWAKTYTNKTEPKFYVGQDYFMEATSTDELSKTMIDSVAWTVSGKGIDYNANGAMISTQFTGNTKKTIKASYITVDRSGKKPKPVKNTKTINITPIQNATSIAFAKPVVVKNPAKKTDKAQAVTFTIKDIVPKKANYGEITWKVLAFDGEKTYVQNTTMEGAEQATLIKPVSKPNYKSVTINVPGTFKAGSVIKVGAYSQVGVVAYGYIYITEQTTKVIPQASTDNGATYSEAGTKKTNQQTMKLGDKNSTLKLSAKLETKYFKDGSTVTNKGNNARNAAIIKQELGNKYSKTIAYETEPVTYSLDKKSATVIKVDVNGNVTPLKRGTATVTIKTLSNKSAKVKIVVE
ncbi:MAG: hypothetical protein K1W38_17710 [Lachnospiraceae bacterium]